jgi:hypothetical protein
LRLSAFIPAALSFNRDIGLQADGKVALENIVKLAQVLSVRTKDLFDSFP